MAEVGTDDGVAVRVAVTIVGTDEDVAVGRTVAVGSVGDGVSITMTATVGDGGTPVAGRVSVGTGSVTVISGLEGSTIWRSLGVPHQDSPPTSSRIPARLAACHHCQRVLSGSNGTRWTIPPHSGRAGAFRNVSADGIRFLAH